LPEAVIDTNVLVYDTFEDSIYHEAAASLLDRWLVPLVVVYEYVWVLKGLNVSPADAREKLLEYLLEEKCTIMKEGADEIRWVISTRAEEGLSLPRFNNKVLLSVAIRRNAPLATFDTRLRRQATKLGLRVVPETI